MGIPSLVFETLSVYMLCENRHTLEKLTADAASRLGLLMAFTMTLHNMPEGLAVAFSSYTGLGWVMAIAIAMHNIPEGIIVAAPVFAATGSRAHALLIATLSGLSEPFGALLAILFVKPFLTTVRIQCTMSFMGVLSLLLPDLL
jgi:zinc transporter, ZIP family